MTTSAGDAKREAGQDAPHAVQPAEAERERLVRALEVERARLVDVFRQAPAFLAVLRGPAHVFELVNDAYYQLVGHRALLGTPVVDALPEVRDQGFVALLDRVLDTGEPFVGRELPLRLARTPGAPPEERFVDFVYQPLADADGTRAGVIAHGTDVTAQVRARREVERLLGESERARAEAERARAEAETAGRLKSEFLSTMSHEFRTPLNAILGYAQLLEMGVLGATTPAQDAHLERLQTSARHLLRLVDDVLDIAKVDADRLDVRREALATGAAVAAALALVQPQATAKGIRVEDLGVLGAGVLYVGDEHRVRQILVNLLSNAVKFTPPGGTITVTCGAVAEPDPGVQPGGAGSPEAWNASPERAWAFVRVQDTGPGIAPELGGRLFEPFSQGDGALTRAHGGTGLGLAISRRLARLMGGDLTVQNRPGAAATDPDPSGAATSDDGTRSTGARFTLWLPAPPAADRPAMGRDVGADTAGPAWSGPEAVGAGGRRTPAGMTAVAGGMVAALTADAYAVLHALGTRLAASAESVSERYVAALRADDRFPGVRDLPGVQLRDHTTPVIGLLASRLMAIGETRGRAPALLADGVQAQRVLAELHGAQRHRLGWAEADVAREMPLLQLEVERALAGAFPDSRRGADDAGRPGGDVDGADSAPAEAAARYAADVTRSVLDQAADTALRAYRFARAAASP